MGTVSQLLDSYTYRLNDKLKDPFPNTPHHHTHKVYIYSADADMITALLPFKERKNKRH